MTTMPGGSVPDLPAEHPTMSLENMISGTSNVPEQNLYFRSNGQDFNASGLPTLSSLRRRLAVSPETGFPEASACAFIGVAAVVVYFIFGRFRSKRSSATEDSQEIDLESGN